MELASFETLQAVWKHYNTGEKRPIDMEALVNKLDRDKLTHSGKKLSLRDMILQGVWGGVKKLGFFGGVCSCTGYSFTWTFHINMCMSCFAPWRSQCARACVFARACTRHGLAVFGRAFESPLLRKSSQRMFPARPCRRHVPHDGSFVRRVLVLLAHQAIAPERGA